MMNYTSYKGNQNLKYGQPLLGNPSSTMANFNDLILMRTPQYTNDYNMRRSLSGLKFQGSSSIPSKPFYRDFTSPRSRNNVPRGKFETTTPNIKPSTAPMAGLLGYN